MGTQRPFLRSPPDSFYGIQAYTEIPLICRDLSTPPLDCRMGILRRCQYQKSSSPTRQFGEVGVRQPHVYNNHCHNSRDFYKYLDTEASSFTLSWCSC